MPNAVGEYPNQKREEREKSSLSLISHQNGSEQSRSSEEGAHTVSINVLDLKTFLSRSRRFHTK
jgi:hypothetical protein